MSKTEQKTNHRTKQLRAKPVESESLPEALRTPDSERIESPIGIASTGTPTQRHEAKTYKLGEISSESAGSPFSLLLRMPGWHTDAIDDHPKGKSRLELFPEETVGHDYSTGTTIPFAVPFGDATKEWLGDSIPDPQAGEPDLTKVIRGLATLARNYNATLYLLRQYHFCLKFGATAPAPENHYGPRNSAGRLPHPDPNNPLTTTIAFAREVEKCWVDASTALDQAINVLDPILIAADMIEVNGYIVSMRIVTKPKAPIAGRFAGLEISGSSSHVSISSAFSSS